jgi:hypothetical protein
MRPYVLPTVDAHLHLNNDARTARKRTVLAVNAQSAVLYQQNPISYLSSALKRIMRRCASGSSNIMAVQSSTRVPDKPFHVCQDLLWKYTSMKMSSYL